MIKDISCQYKGDNIFKRLLFEGLKTNLDKLLLFTKASKWISKLLQKENVYPYSKKKPRVNNSLHLWSEEISFVEEWILLDSNSSRVKIHYTQRMESRPVHSIFTPKEVITDVTTQGVTSVKNRVKIHSIFFLESISRISPAHKNAICYGGKTSYSKASK